MADQGGVNVNVQASTKANVESGVAAGTGLMVDQLSDPCSNKNITASTKANEESTATSNAHVATNTNLTASTKQNEESSVKNF